MAETTPRSGARPILVTIDDECCFPAWSFGDSWNGWECPFFERAAADAVAKHFALRHDSATDSFVEEGDECGPDDDQWEAQEIIGADGAPVKVWPIGAWAWIWSETEPAPEYMRRKITTEAEAEAFIRKLHSEGNLFHFEDSPETIVRRLGTERVFRAAECMVLRERVAEMYALEGFDPCAIAVTLVED